MDWYTKAVESRVKAVCEGRSSETISEIAGAIGVSRSTLNRKMRAQQLKARAKFARRPPDLDFQIKKTIENGEPLAGLARKLNLPLSTLHARAMRNGLLKQPSKKPWSPEEDAYLLELELPVPEALAKKWKGRFGFSRTASAISQRVRFLQGTTQISYPWYTCSQVSELLGISRETVVNWCRGGVLKAQRDGRDKTTWIIHQNWLRLAVIYKSINVDLRKIPVANQTWFVDMVADPVNGHRTDHRKSKD